MLKKGKLYLFKGHGWIQKQAGPQTGIDMPDGNFHWSWIQFKNSCAIGVINNSVIMFLEQSHEFPYTYKVIFQDQIGWLLGNPEQFEELSTNESP